MLDELLLGNTHQEGWNVDCLFADCDVFLSDKNTGVMDRSCDSTLLDQSLESALQELGGSKTENKIELALVVLQEAKSYHTSDKGLTYSIHFN